MAVPFRSMEEITDRMHSSVCIFEGDPVYITGSVELDPAGVLKPGFVKLPFDVPAHGGMMRPRGLQNILVTDPGWSVKDFNLGYLNDDHNEIPRVLYVTRMPVRGLGYKAGLTESNLTGFDRHLSFFTALAGQNFKNMLLNKYPSYQVAHARVLIKGGTIAFDKQLAVEQSEDIFHLYYRDRKIASSLTGEAYKVNRQHIYLKELLVEKRIRIIEA